MSQLLSVSPQFLVANLQSSIGYYVEQLGFPMIAIGEADEIAAAYDVEFIPGLMVVDGAGTVIYRRRSTNLPAGQSIAEQWDREVRQALDALIHESSSG